MAVPANTHQTYAAVGNREDLSDVISRIAPTETPFMSGIGKTTADGTLHEFQTQDLAAPSNNAKVEGDDAANDAAAVTVRLGNRTQISAKTAQVSGTQEGVKKAGAKSEMARQISLKSLELKRDMETALTQNTTAVTGSASVARQLRGLEGWIATNSDLGVGGANPNYITNTAPTDGTQRAFTESQLKTVLQKIWNEGGNPDTIMVGGSQKQAFSGFTGGATKFNETDDKKLTASIDVYVSDFGTLKVVPNRFQRARTAFVLEMDKWKLAVLRPHHINPLAKNGDSERKQIVVEYTLESLNEKASGVVRDLS